MVLGLVLSLSSRGGFLGAKEDGEVRLEMSLLDTDGLGGTLASGDAGNATANC